MPFKKSLLLFLKTLEYPNNPYQALLEQLVSLVVLLLWAHERACVHACGEFAYALPPVSLNDGNLPHFRF